MKMLPVVSTLGPLQLSGLGPRAILDPEDLVSVEFGPLAKSFVLGPLAKFEGPLRISGSGPFHVT